jgi:hypothetical protein
MARFMFLVWPKVHQSRSPGGLFYPWAVLAAGVVLLAPIGTGSEFVDPYWGKLDSLSLWKATWPIFLAVLVTIGMWGVLRLAPALNRLQVPQGDILHLALWLWRITVYTFATRELRDTTRTSFRFALSADRLSGIKRRICSGRMKPVTATELFIVLLSVLSLFLFLSMSS